MPLDPEQIKSLLYKQETKTLTKPPNKRQRDIEEIKAKRKFIRRATQYPSLPPDGPVSRCDDYPTLRCASRGCSSPTCFKLRGVPYCSIHLIDFLAIEITDHERRLNGNSHGNTDYF